MSTIELSILIVIAILIAIMIGVIAASYWTHIEMTLRSSQRSTMHNFEELMKVYDEYSSNKNLEYYDNGKTIILVDNGDEIIYINASIIRIKGKYWILYPVSWYIYCIWQIKLTFNNKRKASNKV